MILKKSHLKNILELKIPTICLKPCVIKNFRPEIEIPDDADAVYLGISSWGRMNGHSGPYLQYEHVKDDLYKVSNMLSGHAILYLTEEYVKMCQRITYHAGYVIEANNTSLFNAIDESHRIDWGIVNVSQCVPSSSVLYNFFKSPAKIIFVL